MPHQNKYYLKVILFDAVNNKKTLNRVTCDWVYQAPFNFRLT
jgi:hypothetical protein